MLPPHQGMAGNARPSGRRQARKTASSNAASPGAKGHPPWRPQFRALLSNLRAGGPASYWAAQSAGCHAHVASVRRSCRNAALTFASPARLRRCRAAAGSFNGAGRQLKLPVTVQKTISSSPCPAEPLSFLGYRILRRLPRGRSRCVYPHPGPAPTASENICRTISKLTVRRHGSLPAATVVERPHRRTLAGWANSLRLGQVSPAYRAVHPHAAPASCAECRLLTASTRPVEGNTCSFPSQQFFAPVKACSRDTSDDEGPSVGEGEISTERPVLATEPSPATAPDASGGPAPRALRLQQRGTRTRPASIELGGTPWTYGRARLRRTLRCRRPLSKSDRLLVGIAAALPKAGVELEFLQGHSADFPHCDSHQIAHTPRHLPGVPCLRRRLMERSVIFDRNCGLGRYGCETEWQQLKRPDKRPNPGRRDGSTSGCSETSCCASGWKSRRRNLQFGVVVISGRRTGRPGDLMHRK